MKTRKKMLHSLRIHADALKAATPNGEPNILSPEKLQYTLSHVLQLIADLLEEAPPS